MSSEQGSSFEKWWGSQDWSEAEQLTADETIRPAELRQLLVPAESELPLELAQALAETGLMEAAPSETQPEEERLSPAQDQTQDNSLRAVRRKSAPSLLELPFVSLFEQAQPLAPRPQKETLYQQAPDGSFVPIKANDLPDFRIAGVLGEGGMGQVCLAQQRSLQRDVAIKRLRPGETRHVAVDSLLHEGRIMGALSHPNVIPVHALGRDANNQPVLVMKRIEGVSWLTLMQSPTHPIWQRGFTGQEDSLRRHLRIFLDVCHAMAFAHSRRILHLDLKPENVMVGEYGEVYTLDWGLALRLPQGHKARPLPPAEKAFPTNSVHLAGTPMYMAPEMLCGDVDYLDERTDVYLLGAILHELITGMPRHMGENLKEVIFSAFISAPPDYDESVSEELVRICHKAMHRDIEQRFASVLALRHALETYLSHEGSLQLTKVAHTKQAELTDLILRAVEAQEALEIPLQERPVRPPEEAINTQISQLFVECQFGYQQALNAWPDNPSARSGLEDCLGLMCEYEIHQEREENASSLLSRMQVPPALLQERLEALREQQAIAQQEQERLRVFQQDRDLISLPQDKRSLLAWLVIATLAIGTAVTMLVLPSDAAVGYTGAIQMDLCFSLLVAGGLWFGRESWQARVIYRQLAAFAAVAATFTLVYHPLCMMLALPYHKAITIELFIYTICCVLGGIAFHMWAALSALPVFAGSCLLIWLPQYADTIYFACILTTLGMLLFPALAMRQRSE